MPTYKVLSSYLNSRKSFRSIHMSSYVKYETIGLSTESDSSSPKVFSANLHLLEQRNSVLLGVKMHFLDDAPQ